MAMAGKFKGGQGALMEQAGRAAPGLTMARSRNLQRFVTAA